MNKENDMHRGEGRGRRQLVDAAMLGSLNHEQSRAGDFSEAGNGTSQVQEDGRLAAFVAGPVDDVVRVGFAPQDGPRLVSTPFIQESISEVLEWINKLSGVPSEGGRGTVGIAGVVTESIVTVLIAELHEPGMVNARSE
jgi:hypothetical protein